MSLTITIDFNEDMITQLEKIPLQLRLGPGERCLRAMSKPVLELAKQLAPSSRESGSRKKWSAKFKNDPKWSVDSRNHLGVKTIKNNRATRIYIGAKYPQGNKQQFDASPKGRRVFYWGRDAGKVRQRPNPHWLQKAYDETKSQQLAAFNEQLAKELKELRLG